MNLAANTDFVQATIEIFGAIICIISAVLFYMITGGKKKSEKSLLLLIASVTVSLLVDAGWYIFDGNMSQFGVIANMVCNYAIFLCNPFSLLCASDYIYNLIKEEAKKPKEYLFRIVYTFIIITMAIPISNLFYAWMFAFDEFNVYYRLFGWYVYTAINLITILILTIVIFAHRKDISKGRRLTLYLFALTPLIGTALQAFSLGFSFIQIGAAISLMLVLNSYVKGWIDAEKSRNEFTGERKNFWIIEGVFLIMVFCISAAIISCAISVDNVSRENSQQNSKAMAYMVNETIDGALAEPVNVSRTLAQSELVIEAVSMDKLEGTETEKAMVEYMKRIRDEFDYQMVFVASDKTKAYYTYDGLSRYMDTENDPRDSWYKEYVNRNVKYELNVDADKDNNMSLAVFVNMEILDENGNYIGACGVAMSMEALMNIISEYEREYDLSVFLVDPNGLVQVSTDRGKIEQEYVDTSIMEQIGKNEITYQRNVKNSRLTKYMSELGWYLIVDDNLPDKLNVFRIIYPSIIIYIIGIGLMIVFTFLFGRHEKHKNAAIRANKEMSETDQLTGVYNRYAFDNHIAKIEEEGIPKDLAVIMIDINGLKNVNDNLGHNAGNEMVVGTAKCIKDAFDSIGKIYRIGGDEFNVLLCCDETKLNNSISKFHRQIGRWQGEFVDELSAAIGVAESNKYPDASINELINEADKLMYRNKNDYYRVTGKVGRTNN